LAKIFSTYEEFRQAIENNYDFSQLPNFGYEKTQALLNFNYVTGDLISEELNITNDFAKQQNEVQDKLKGLIFVVTGKLQTFKNRTELKELVEKNGGKLTDSVSSKTSYLINNDINSNTGKNKTAKSLGVPIITEQQFISLLN
jgi:DNA ligase (NAD+)